MTFTLKCFQVARNISTGTEVNENRKRFTAFLIMIEPKFHRFSNLKFLLFEEIIDHFHNLIIANLECELAGK